MNNKNIVLIHGNSSSEKTFDEVKKYINKEYSITTFDLPGHGNSINTCNIEEFHFKKYLDEVLSVINELEGEIIIYGNSLGGHIAIEIAPEIYNLRGIIIAGTPPLKHPLNLAEGFNLVDALLVYFEENPLDNRVINALDDLITNKSCITQMFDDFSRTNPLVRLALAKNIESENVFQNQYQIFKRLTCNKLIIEGDRDNLISSEYLNRISVECYSDLKRINNCGHFPQIERPIEFSKVLMTFCENSFGK